jgi:hypothetical protein
MLKVIAVILIAGQSGGVTRPPTMEIIYRWDNPLPSVSWGKFKCIKIYGTGEWPW